MQTNTESTLSPAQSKDLRLLAGIMIPASMEFDVPGADDPAIFADIEKSLGRDCNDVQKALVGLCALAGGAFADLETSRRETVADLFLKRGGPEVTTLGRVILSCYYRDDRVVRSLGLEPRPPFPLGHTLEQGDWSLLDPVKKRPKLWRDAP
jgi:hypothetical protein